VISSSGSFDLIEYRPEGHQRAAGLYVNNSFALIYLNADVIAVITAYGALCSLLDPLAVRCPDLTVRKNSVQEMPSSTASGAAGEYEQILLSL
jgi:hypothetical protein